MSKITSRYCPDWLYSIISSFEEFTLKTDRLLLLPISMDYVQEMFNEFTPEVTKYMFPPTPKHIDDTKKFVTESLQKLHNSIDLTLVILDKTTKEWLWNCWIHDIEWGIPEFGIWLKKSAHWKGLWKEAISGLWHWANHNLVFDYIVYPVDIDNLPSRAIPEFLWWITDNVVNPIQTTDPNKIINTITYKLYPSKDL